MADVEMGTLYELNKQVMAQLPPQAPEVLQHNMNLIGAWFSSTDKQHWFMLMCKERSDFTLIHIKNSNYIDALNNLKEVLEERGEILAIQYVHGEDVFEIWVKTKDGEVFMFMLFEASWMVIEV